MTNVELVAFGADRVVMGVRNGDMHKKIFQINFKSKDGSIFVSMPYANLGMGRLGVVEFPPGHPEFLQFGNCAPVTTHSVKYTHHPDGEAHFSLDGKIFTKVRRKAVPLTAAEGHLFTIMVQGLHQFNDISQSDISSPKRGIVSMPIPEGKIEALKFAGYLHSSKHFAERLQAHKMDSAFIPLLQPDGRRIVGVVLASRLTQNNQQYLLIVSVEAIQTIATHTDLYVSLMGGFDPPNIAFDHSRPTSFLMMMYPELGDMAALLKSVGSIDRLVTL